MQFILWKDVVTFLETKLSFGTVSAGRKNIMNKDDLAKIITEVIWSDFEEIHDLYRADDKEALTDEVYEVLENME